MNRLDFLNEKNNDSCCTPCLRGPIGPQGEDHQVRVEC